MTPALAIAGFRWNGVLTITLVVAAGALLLGLLLTAAQEATRRREIGLALVAGAFFVAASGLIQAAADTNQFKLTLMFTQDLSGFNPDGRSLEGLHLNGKRFQAAQLAKVDLRRADLVRSDFRTSDAKGARFDGANLGFAKFGDNSTLAKAHFDGADLRGTQMAGLQLSEAIYKGARVHQFTCWELPTRGDTAEVNRPDIDTLRSTPTTEGQKLLDKLLNSGLKPNAAHDDRGQTVGAQPIGHICTTKEDGRDAVGALDESREIYICLSEPHFRQFEGVANQVEFKC